ncbi:MAG: hypothetical protein ACI9BD_000198, partial [Candidatus Marinamargulisbacteria bacterium]
MNTIDQLNLNYQQLLSELDLYRPSETDLSEGEVSPFDRNYTDEELSNDPLCCGPEYIQDPYLRKILLDYVDAVKDTDFSTEEVAIFKQYLVAGDKDLDYDQLLIVCNLIHKVTSGTISQKLGLSPDQTIALQQALTVLPDRHKEEIEMAKAFRDNLRTEQGITPTEQKFRNRMYLVDPDSETISTFRDQLFKDGILTAKMSDTEIAANILEYVQNQFTYVSEKVDENGVFDDHWQSVEETMAKKQGDCEDLVLLVMSTLMNVFETRRGYSADKVREMITATAGYIENENGAKAGHMMVKLKIDDESGVPLVLTLDPTGKSGLVDLKSLRFEELFELNDTFFIKHKEIDETFYTASYIALGAYKIFLDDDKTWSDYTRPNRDPLLAQINSVVERLEGLIRRPIRVPRLYQGLFYRGADIREASDASAGDFPSGVGSPTNNYTELQLIEMDNLDNGNILTSAFTASLDKTEVGTLSNYEPLKDEDGNPVQSKAIHQRELQKYTNEISQYGTEINALEEQRDLHNTILPNGSRFSTPILFPGQYGTTQPDNVNAHIADLEAKMQISSDASEEHQKAMKAYDLALIAIAEKYQAVAEPIEPDTEIQDVTWVRSVTVEEGRAGKEEEERTGTNQAASGSLIAINSKTEMDELIAKTETNNAAFLQVQAEVAAAKSTFERDPSNEEKKDAYAAVQVKFTKVKEKTFRIMKLINLDEDLISARIDLTTKRDWRFNRPVTAHLGLDDLPGTAAERAIASDPKLFAYPNSNVRADKDYHFFDVRTTKIFMPAGSTAKSTDAMVQQITINHTFFFAYMDEVRRYNNLLSLLFHLTNGYMDAFLNWGRMFNDMGSPDGKADQALAKESDAQRNKMVASFNAFQSKVGDGVTKFTDELFSFIKASNTAMITKRQFQIDKWATTVVEGEGVGAFLGNFIVGGMAEFFDEFTGALSLVRAIAREALAKIEVHVASYNASAYAEYNKFLLKGNRLDTGEFRGGIELWDTVQPGETPPTGIDADWTDGSKEAGYAKATNWGSTMYDYLNHNTDSQIASVDNKTATKSWMVQFLNGIGTLGNTPEHRAGIQDSMKSIAPDSLDDSTRTNTGDYQINKLWYEAVFGSFSPAWKGNIFDMARIAGPKPARQDESLGWNIQGQGAWHESSGKDTAPTGLGALMDEGGADNVSVSSVLLAIVEVLLFPLSGIAKGVFAAVNAADGGGPETSVFLDFNQEKFALFRQRMVKFQNTVFLAIMLKQAFWDHMREQAEAVSGLKGTSSSKSLSKATQQAVEGDLQKMSSGYSALHNEMIGLTDVHNKLIKARIEYYKSTVKIGLKIARIAGHAGIFVAAKTVSATMPTTLAAGPQALVNAPLGVLNPLYWNTMFTTIGGAIVEQIYAGFESEFEKNMGEFSFPDLLQDSPFSGDSAGSAGFSYQGSYHFFDEAKTEAEKWEGNAEGDRQFKTNMTPYSKNEKEFYKAKLKGFLMLPRMEVNPMTDRVKMRMGVGADYVVRNVPGGGKIDHAGTQVGMGPPSGLDPDRYGLHFIEGRGDGFYSYNGELMAQKEKRIAHYRNLIKLWLAILRQIHDAIENQVVLMLGDVGATKAGTLAKFDGVGGFSSINSILDAESQLISDMKTEIKDVLLPAWNENTAKKKTVYENEMAIIMRTIDIGISMLTMIPWSVGVAAHGVAEFAAESADLSRKYGWGLYPGTLANYHDDENIQNRSDKMRLGLDPTTTASVPLHGSDNRDQKLSHPYAYDPPDIPYELKQPFNSAWDVSEYTESSRWSKFGFPSDNKSKQGVFNKVKTIYPWLNQDDREKQEFHDLYAHSVEDDSLALFGFGYFQRVNYQKAIETTKALNSIITTRMMMEMFENALYQAKQGVLKDMFNVSSSAQIVQNILAAMDNYHEGILAAYQDILAEMVSRVESANTKVQDTAGATAEVLGMGAMIPLIVNDFKEVLPPTPTPPATGGSPDLALNMIRKSFAKKSARAVTTASANFLTGLVALLTVKQSAEAESSFAYYEDDHNNSVDSEAIKEKEDENKGLEEKKENGTITDEEQSKLDSNNTEIDKRQGQIDKRNSSDKKHDIRSEDAKMGGGKITVNQSVLNKALKKIKQQQRRMELLTQLTMASQDAIQDAAGDIGGIEKTGANKGIMKIISQTARSEQQAAEHAFASLKQKADAQNRAINMIRTAVMSLGTKLLEKMMSGRKNDKSQSNAEAGKPKEAKDKLKDIQAAQKKLKKKKMNKKRGKKAKEKKKEDKKTEKKDKTQSENAAGAEPQDKRTNSRKFINGAKEMATLMQNMIVAVIFEAILGGSSMGNTGAGAMAMNGEDASQDEDSSFSEEGGGGDGMSTADLENATLDSQVMQSSISVGREKMKQFAQLQKASADMLTRIKEKIKQGVKDKVKSRLERLGKEIQIQVAKGMVQNPDQAKMAAALGDKGTEQHKANILRLDQVRKQLDISDDRFKAFTNATEQLARVEGISLDVAEKNELADAIKEKAKIGVEIKDLKATSTDKILIDDEDEEVVLKNEHIALLDEKIKGFQDRQDSVDHILKQQGDLINIQDADAQLGENEDGTGEMSLEKVQDYLKGTLSDFESHVKKQDKSEVHNEFRDLNEKIAKDTAATERGEMVGNI